MSWVKIRESIQGVRCCPRCKVPLEYNMYVGYHCLTCGYEGDGIPCKLKTVWYVEVEEDKDIQKEVIR